MDWIWVSEGFVGNKGSDKENKALVWVFLSRFKPSTLYDWGKPPGSAENCRSVRINRANTKLIIKCKKLTRKCKKLI